MRDPLIEEIKNKVGVLEVIGEYLTLKKSGVNWKALCPFHQEKTPSFMVNPEKGIWHCFGCGSNGDVFSFLQKIEGMEFPEVLRRLADRAGINLPKVDPRVRHERNTLADILEIAAKFYQENLKKEEGETALKYLKNRGLTDKTIEQWRIGYAQSGYDKLLNFLTARGFRQKEIAQAGLAVLRAERPGFYDRFRARIIFPIMNVHGEVIGFTGRIMPSNEGKEEGGKYINTPETPLYHKGSVLFGLNFSKEAIKKEGRVVIVEGNMDVITSHQAGVQNVVASSGTAITDTQLKLLSRYTKRIVLAFDSDTAGSAAAKRGIDLALQRGFDVEVIAIPPEMGNDPDDCARRSPMVWKNLVLNPTDYFDYLFEQTLKNKDLSSLDDRRKIRNELIPEITRHNDALVRFHYLKKLSEILDVPVQLLNEEAQLIRQTGGKGKPEEPAKFRKSRLDELSERIMAAFLTKKELREIIISRLKSQYLPSDIRALYNEAVSYYNREGEKSGDDFSAFLKAKASILEQKCNVLLMLGVEIFKNIDRAKLEKEVISMIEAIIKIVKTKEREILIKEMEEAEKFGDVARIKYLSQKFHELI